MGFFDGLLNSVEGLFGDTPNNNQFTAQSAPILQPVTTGQVNQATGTATNALGQNNNLVQALAAANGINHQSQVFNSEQALANMYKAIASGQGPNPVQDQLNQTTGQNVANQAALGAGQRGTNANVGLAARQIAQQAANTQQQAVGQAATLNAEQQLAALQGLGQTQNNMANLATTQAGQQIGATENYGTEAINNQNSILQALQGFNTNQVQNTASQNDANAKVAINNSNNTGETLGGVANGLAGFGATLAIPKAAHGGEVQKDGEIGDARKMLQKAIDQKKFPEHLRAIARIHHPKLIKMYEGGESEAHPAVVPGKAPYPGKNTEKNDIVPALLSSGEIVLPLSVTEAKNPGEAAKSFVENIKGKKDFKESIREHVKKRKNKA